MLYNGYKRTLSNSGLITGKKVNFILILNTSLLECVYSRWIRCKVIIGEGLVIFNPAVGGQSTGKGGQNLLKTCLRGDEKIVHFL